MKKSKHKRLKSNRILSLKCLRKHLQRKLERLPLIILELAVILSIAPALIRIIAGKKMEESNSSNKR